MILLKLLITGTALRRGPVSLFREHAILPSSILYCASRPPYPGFPDHTQPTPFLDQFTLRVRYEGQLARELQTDIARELLPHYPPADWVHWGSSEPKGRVAKVTAELLASADATEPGQFSGTVIGRSCRLCGTWSDYAPEIPTFVPHEGHQFYCESCLRADLPSVEIRSPCARCGSVGVPGAVHSVGVICDECLRCNRSMRSMGLVRLYL